MRRIWVFLVALGCGGAPPLDTLPEAHLSDLSSVSLQDAAFQALGAIRTSSGALGDWRPTSVHRLDDTLALLSDSHAFIWKDGAWQHVQLPGRAPFGTPSMQAPELRVKSDGHRALFAGPSERQGEGAPSLGLFQLTQDGVESIGVLPAWVVSCRTFVATGTHLYVVVSDAEREREGTILHAESGAGPDDWQALDFVNHSNQPDKEMWIVDGSAIMLEQSDGCRVMTLPGEGPRFEPALLFEAGQRSCKVRVSDGLSPSRILVYADSITIHEEGETREVPWPSDGVPFERAEDYEGYDALSPGERQGRESDHMARMMSPGLVAFRPLLFERFRPAGETEQQRGAFRLPLTSSFQQEEGGAWTALPLDEGEAFAMIGGMHFAALTRPRWSPPVNWGDFRVAVAEGQWGSETPTPVLRVWRADGTESVYSAFPSLPAR